MFCIEHRHEKGDGYDLVSNGALAAQSALIVRNHLRLAACDKAWDKSWTAVIKGALRSRGSPVRVIDGAIDFTSIACRHIRLPGTQGQRHQNHATW